jgi:HSP20 family protein
LLDYTLGCDCVSTVENDDQDVGLTESTVTIKGSKSSEQKEGQGGYYRCEIARGRFSRTVALPSVVDTDKAEASCKDGMLELKIAMFDKAKRRGVKRD